MVFWWGRVLRPRECALPTTLRGQSANAAQSDALSAWRRDGTDRPSADAGCGRQGGDTPDTNPGRDAYSSGMDALRVGCVDLHPGRHGQTAAWCDRQLLAHTRVRLPRPTGARRGERRPPWGLPCRGWRKPWPSCRGGLGWFDREHSPRPSRICTALPTMLDGRWPRGSRPRPRRRRGASGLEGGSRHRTRVDPHAGRAAGPTTARRSGRDIGELDKHPGGGHE
jgi:hypothetical protein